MIGIDVGAAAVTRSDGVLVKLPQNEIPHDLLTRVADDIPYINLVKGIRPNDAKLHCAHEIYANAVAAAIHAQKNEEDEKFAVAIPGWWSPQTRKKVLEALNKKELQIMLVNDAEAAVVAYQHYNEKLTGTVAVLSLQAEHSGVVLVQNCQTKPTAMLSPTSVISEGGQQLDRAILRHLVEGLEAVGHSVDITDANVVKAAQKSLNRCATLRHDLQTVAAATISPELPNSVQKMRVVRSELEELATPWANRIIAMMQEVIEQCQEPVEGVLITGELATMPLISQRISADLALDVHVPDEPDLVGAVGAELILMRSQEPVKKTNTFLNFFMNRSAEKSKVVAKSSRTRQGNGLDLAEVVLKT